MKKMILVVAAALSVLTGCKTVPTAETVNNVSYTMGASTAIVIKMMKLDSEVLTTVNMVLASVKEVVPQQGQTFNDVWTPIADKAIDKLVAESRITDNHAKYARQAVNGIIKGIDRLFEKNTKWVQYEDLVRVGVDAFLNGYNVVMKFKTSYAAENADQAEVEILCNRCEIKFDPDLL
jgi:hypothetical protein